MLQDLYNIAQQPYMLPTNTLYSPSHNTQQNNRRKQFIAEYSQWKQTSYDDQANPIQMKKHKQSIGYAKGSRNQIGQSNAIQQLRQQYEILRDLPINGAGRSSNVDYSLLSYSSSKQSLKNSSQKPVQPNYNVFMMEKQQLQLVISNSMKKIQELLKKQAEYKRIIHEMEMQTKKLIKKADEDNDNDEIVYSYKKKEQEYRLKIEELQEQVRNLRNQVYQLQEKYRHLQKQLRDTQEQNQILRQRIRQSEQQIIKQRRKNSELQISYTKIQKQYNILERNFKNQIAELIKQNNKTYHQQINKNQILQLQRKLYEAQTKYNILLEEFQRIQNLQSQPIIEHKDNTTNAASEMMYHLITKIREQSDINRNNSMQILKDVLQKMNIEKHVNIQQPVDNRQSIMLIQEIMLLRKEVNNLKKGQKKQKKPQIKNSCRQYLYKIDQLRQKLENSQKRNSELHKQLDSLKKDQKALRNVYDALKEQYSLLKQELDKLKKQGASLQNIRTLFRNKQIQLQQNIHNLKKQSDDKHFIISKLQRQKDYQLNQIKANHQVQLNTYKASLQRGRKDQNLLRGQLDKMKKFYDIKLLEKSQLVQKIINQYTVMIQNNQKSLNAFKSNNQKEIIQLINKLKGMDQLNQSYLKALQRISQLQRQILQLRERMPNLKGMNQNIEHLWVVKQAQYKNLNGIISEIKNKNF